MITRKKNPPLLGYASELSVHPGQRIDFKISSASNAPYTARLVRSICADPNPDGPGIIETDASACFPQQQFPSVNRNFTPGSCAMGQSAIAVEPGVGVVFRAMVYLTLRSSTRQCVLSAGDRALVIDENGAASFVLGEEAVSTGMPLQLRAWYLIRGQYDRTGLTIEQHCLDAAVAQSATASISIPVHSGVAGVPVVGARLTDAGRSQHFNGKIEAPRIESAVDGTAICDWDFSRDMSTTRVTATAGPDLELINYPARAMTGTAWDGSEMNWNHRPDHYAAIHFHEDDIYDFEWDTDFSFTVPETMPGGAYVMRLACDGAEDAIPFFVTTPVGKSKHRLCLLVSTFTFSIYGNHARPDYKPAWQERINAWDAYPHNPAEYPHYGLSTYNFHTDGSGICHASHRRPLFNLRPGYLTFGASTCSGLRHFQADSHLISWLHHKGIEYDLVSDMDLHRDGYEAIRDYAVVCTGSHPEYHTEQSLDALQAYRDNGGHLAYLGGNGFYWRIAVHPENHSMLEIRRAEDGIRAWAAEPGEYYNAFDGAYGGLWRRNGRAPQRLAGVGFTAQGTFVGDPYRRLCHDPAWDWVFDGIDDELIGDFGYSGNGAAGFELDHMDYRLGTPENAVLLARSVTRDEDFMLVPEEQLTHLSNLSGKSEADAKHADMIYVEYPGGGSVFATGSITFCGSLPWNNFDNNVSRLLENILNKHLS